MPRGGCEFSSFNVNLVWLVLSCIAVVCGTVHWCCVAARCALAVSHQHASTVSAQNRRQRWPPEGPRLRTPSFLLWHSHRMEPNPATQCKHISIVLKRYLLNVSIIIKWVFLNVTCYIFQVIPTFSWAARIAELSSAGIILPLESKKHSKKWLTWKK